MTTGLGSFSVGVTGQSITEHVKRTLTLALPVVGARMGEIVMVVVDTAMIGHYDARELAYFGLARQPWMFLFVIGLGSLIGVSVLVAQAHGADDHRRCGAIWRVSVLQAGIVGGVIVVLCQFGTAFLALTGQDADLAGGAGDVIRAYGWGAPAVMIYLATTYFMQGISRPVPDMTIMVGANLLNVGLNWVLIGGNLGAPALGAEGAVLATSLVYWIAAATFVGYVLTMRRSSHYALRSRVKDAARIGRTLRRLSYPLALSVGLETGTYLTLALMAGLLGAHMVAAYQVGVTVLHIAFMLTIGIGVATSIRVGNAVGRHDPINLRRAAWVGCSIAVASMAVCSLALALWPERVARIFTDDGSIVPILKGCLLVAATYLVFEGGQMVVKMSLRGLGDVWVPLCIALGAFWLAGVPAAACLAFGLGYGAPGLYGGLGVAMVLSAIGYALRFRAVSSRAISRL